MNGETNFNGVSSGAEMNVASMQVKSNGEYQISEGEHDGLKRKSKKVKTLRHTEGIKEGSKGS